MSGIRIRRKRAELTAQTALTERAVRARDDPITEADGRPVALTRSEFDLLAILMQPGDRVHTKAELICELRRDSLTASGFVSRADKRSLEVHVANVRKKLGRSTAGTDHIETVRGVAYRLTTVRG